jgi:serine/threonine protein kinase
MSIVSRLRSLFERRTISVSDEPSSDAEVMVGRTVVSHERDRSGEGRAEDSSGTALGSRSPEPTALQIAEQQDWEIKQLKIWQKGDVILDRYQVEDVKMGGMGYVYIAKHRDWNVEMAIKSPNQMMLSNRFLFSRVLREADSWIELGLHPHIAYCYYVLQIEDVPHIFIEYVDGGSLSEWIADGRCYDLKVGLDLAVQFCHGMGYAHEHGMIHRDIKPGNLLMTKEGILKITDFGIAKTQEAETRQRYSQVSDEKWTVSDGQLTTVDTIIGSADYMSPEQWEDPRHVDARADIYSFGVCLYSMFYGMKPYESTSIEAKEKGRKPYDPLKLREDIPRPLVDLLRKSVALEREERVRSCEELRGELLGIYRDLFQEEPPHAELKTIGLRADSLNNRAVSYVELGKGREAMELWDEALREDPRHSEVIYNRGVVLWRRGQLTDKTLVDQLELSGSGAEWLADYLLALVHLERGDIDSVVPLLGTVAQQVPEEPEVQSALRLARSDGIFACGLLRTFEGHMNEVNSVCLSADGCYALLGSRGNVLQLWDAATGEYLRTFEGHTNEVTSVYLSADGRYALSGSKDKNLKLWDASTGECLQTFRGHENEVTSVSLSVDGQYAL